jgi:hypothetical protein
MKAMPLLARRALLTLVSPTYHHSGRYLNEVNVTNIRNVTNITNITKVTNINNVHYAYRTIATTAVSRDVLGSGKPVAHQMVRVSAQELARAEMTPHPPVNPTKRAAVSGKPVPPPSAPGCREQNHSSCRQTGSGWKSAVGPTGNQKYPANRERRADRSPSAEWKNTVSIPGA